MAETAAPSFLDALDDPVVEQQAVVLVPEVVPARRLRAAADPQLEKLRGIEDRILEKSMSIIEGCLHGAYVDDGQDELPQEWIAEVGMKGAVDRLRMAKDARMSPKMHPVYMDLAKSTFVGIVKARASSPAATQSLNVNITLAAPKAAYAIIDLEPDQEK